MSEWNCSWGYDSVPWQKKNSFLIKKIICTQFYAVFFSISVRLMCTEHWGEHAKCRWQPYFLVWLQIEKFRSDLPLFFFLSPTASMPKAIILDERRRKKKEFNICIYIWYFYHLMCVNFCVFSAILFRLKISHFVYPAFWLFCCCCWIQVYFTLHTHSLALGFLHRARWVCVYVTIWYST